MRLPQLPLSQIPSPAYVCEEARLEKNLQTLDYIQKQSGATILLALKGFAMWSTFPLVKKYLRGACASGLYEAQLARKRLGGEVHTFSPGYKDVEFPEILRLSDHVVFNSFHQWQHFRQQAIKAKVSCGIRVNPGVSASPKAIYDPCSPKSRLGVTRAEFRPELLAGITGLHFHALCEKTSYDLEKVLKGFEKNFGAYIRQMEWVNFGGGHWITHKEYDVEHLIKVIRAFRARYPNLKSVYLEPGEAVGWQTGPLVATVLDIVKNGGNQLAILDTSFSAHMPDCLEMPYDPRVRNSGAELGQKFSHAYYFGGPTCLAGDFINTPYTFKQPLKAGDRIIFEDMIHYTFVKSTMFNGVRHPALAILRKSGKLDIVREFTYQDFERRLS